MVTTEIEKKILSTLPYGKAFMFVDRIIEISDNGITGTFEFPETALYYEGHFTKKAVTPGVLLLETMGQIGLVCFGIYLLKIHENGQTFMPVLSHLESDFMGMVFPGERVTVHSQKVYFRNNILKCNIKMQDSQNNIVLTTTAICSFKMEKE